MGASIFFTAAMIHAFRSARSRGNGGTNTLHEIHVARQPQFYSCDIPAHKTTSSPERPFFLLHTLVSPSGRNVNYDEKQLTGKLFFFELFLPSVQVS